MLQKWSIFDNMFEFLGPLRNTPWDIHEDGKEFKIEIDLPGVELPDINVNVLDGELSIKAERKWAKVGDRSTFRRSFSETFILPQTVDSSGISAKYVQGVLYITIPKRGESAAKKIEIKTI